MSDFLPGVHVAPNIQTAPDLYEIENRAADPEQRIEAGMRSLAAWNGRIVLDLGAGTGFHVPRWHDDAAHVIAVEPHDSSRVQIMRRVAALNLERVSVMTGSAERILLPPASVDVIHARFAYFFAPNCLPGLAEVARVLRPGGTAFIIDNDLRHGQFAEWLKRHPFAAVDPAVVEGFWSEQGYQLTRIPSEWRFDNRVDLEAVVRLEFGEGLGNELLRDHTGLSVEYHYALYWRHF